MRNTHTHTVTHKENSISMSALQEEEVVQYLLLDYTTLTDLNLDASLSGLSQRI